LSHFAAGGWSDGKCIAFGNPGHFFLSYNPHHPEFQPDLLTNKYFYDAQANGGWSLQNTGGSHRWANSGDINGQTLCITKKSPFKLRRANVDQSAYKYSSVWGGNDQQREEHSQGTIDSKQGWSAASNDGGQWIQMNLGSPKWVDGIVTQGRREGALHFTPFCSTLPAIAHRLCRMLQAVGLSVFCPHF